MLITQSVLGSVNRGEIYHSEIHNYHYPEDPVAKLSKFFFWLHDFPSPENEPFLQEMYVWYVHFDRSPTSQYGSIRILSASMFNSEN